MTGAACLFAPRAAHAFRPFDGTDAHVAEPHLLEIEAGPLGYLRLGSQRLLVAPQAVVNYGTGSGFEFALEGRGIMLMNPSGDGAPARLQDAALVAKKVLRRGVLQHLTGPSIATEAAVLFPASGERGVGGSASLILSQHWRPLGMHVDVAMSRTRKRQLGRFVSVIGEGPERWPVRPALELSLESEGDESAVRGLLAGLIWQTRQGLTMDAAVRTAHGDEHELELRTGFTWKMQLPAH